MAVFRCCSAEWLVNGADDRRNFPSTFDRIILSTLSDGSRAYFLSEIREKLLNIFNVEYV